MLRGRRGPLLLAAFVALAACGGDDDGGGAAGPFVRQTTAAAAATTETSDAPPETDPTVPGTDAPATATGPAPPGPPPQAADLQGIAVTATQITDVEMLTSIAWRDGDPDPYLGDQHGMVYHLVDGNAEQVLDLTPEVLDWEQGAEYGFLAMRFDPRNGRLVVCYDDNERHTRIESYAVGEDGRPNKDTMWEIVVVDNPGRGHNCGQLAFDGDGNLLWSHGDGGGSRGADAQDMTKLLGGIFRITPNRDGPGYTVPDDNPYAGRDDVAPEILAKGFRNPWRFSIDPRDGDLWVGDVGENTWESVYRVPVGQAGVNAGWPRFEGDEETNFNAEVSVTDDTVAPVHAYTHAEVGPSVIGGLVYRGSAIPRLQGAYVFMDMTGPVFAMGADHEVVRVNVEIGGIQTSIGEDPDGELYILTLGKGAYRLDPAGAPDGSPEVTEPDGG